VLPVLALLTVFGQRPTTSSANALAADLIVTAPAYAARRSSTFAFR
jgi:hypothetical protein